MLPPKMEQRKRGRGLRRRDVLAAATPLFCGAAGSEAAADPDGDARAALSPAQVALFETPHLASLRPPLRLLYGFRREEAGKEPVADTVRLAVRASAASDGARDVSAEFLSGPRALRYPPALGFRGNPLLIFALDRDTRELSAATGGSQQWFRNRVRHALATSADVRATTVEHGGKRFAATAIALLPYAGEPRAGRFGGRRYEFVLAEALPGVVHAIRTDLPAGEGGAGEVSESIVFAGTEPLPEGAG